MNAIVAIDNKNGIGKDGELLVKLKADMKWFKNITTNKVVIMGRKTMESIGKPLPDRLNIVLTRNYTINRPGYVFLHSIKDLMIFLRLKRISPKDCFVIGGQQIYKALEEQIAYVYVTKIFKTFDSDVKFPISFSNLEMITSSQIQEENGISFEFRIYKNCKLFLNFIRHTLERPLYSNETKLIKKVLTYNDEKLTMCSMPIQNTDVNKNDRQYNSDALKACYGTLSSDIIIDE